MEHRGVEYRIIQGIQRGFWKWSVETKTGTKSGTSNSKDEAMNAANSVFRLAFQCELYRDRFEHPSSCLWHCSSA